MSCKYLQGFIDSISGLLLFVTMVWMIAVGKTKLLLGGLCFFSQHIEVLLPARVVVHNLSLYPLWDKWSRVQQIFMMMAILVLSIYSLPVECLYEVTDFVKGL